MVGKIKQDLNLVAVFLGIFAFLMIFFPAVYLDMWYFIGEDFLLGVNGWDCCFGFEFIEREIFGVSLMCLLTYTLPLVGVICICFGERDKDIKYIILAIVCFITGMVCFSSMSSLIEVFNSKRMKHYITIGTGAILGSISCALAVLCLLANIKSLKNKSENKER